MWCLGVHPSDPRVCRAVTALAAEDIMVRMVSQPIRIAPGSGARGPVVGVLVVDGIPDRPDDDLCTTLREITRDGRQRVLVIALPADGLDPEQCWRLLSAGASDVLAWDRTPEPAEAAAARLRRWLAVDELVASPSVRDCLVGCSPAWRSVVRQVVEVARFTSLSMLITGESGTGKELVAQVVHELDPRPSRAALVVLDCTTIVPTLSGSEFFGHERGAFTGATSQRQGVFGAADGGTLFLDEVGELPLPLQAELLRVIQEGTYKPVGGNTWHKTRFRLICATNRDLAEQERRGTFRRDFYQRIAAWRCTLPSLHERRRDVIPLAEHFVRQTSGGDDAPGFDPAVRAFLIERSYPGNVRELRNLVERISQRHVGPGPITVGDVPDDERPGGGAIAGAGAESSFEDAVRLALAGGASLKEISTLARDTAIRLAIDQEGGNLQRASRILDVTDRALQLRRAAQTRS
jgi:transcriptional regulator with GAF, ATPase, and Fis domain